MHEAEKLLSRGTQDDKVSLNDLNTQLCRPGDRRIADITVISQSGETLHAALAFVITEQTTNNNINLILTGKT